MSKKTSKRSKKSDEAPTAPKFDYKTVQNCMLQNWQEDIKCGKDLEQYITKNALTHKNLGNMHHLVSAFDSMPKDEQEKFFKTVLPQIVSVAQFVTTGPKSNLLARFNAKNNKLTLTRFEIASLLANAFLCTLPPQSGGTDINFSNIFSCSCASSSHKEKIKCLVNYFGYAFDSFDADYLREVVTYKRSIVAVAPDFAHSMKPMIPMNFVSKGSIANAHNMAQVNFANKRVGGNVLECGSLREEMWFISCPELIVARLFCDCMADNEAIVVEGVLQFSEFRGSGDTFECIGPMNLDSFRGPHTVICMDATNFGGSPQQFCPASVGRELTKAFAGFTSVKGGTIATGNWGGGCFGGDPELKGKIQNIAASQANKALFYYPFNDAALEARIETEVQLDEPVSVGEAYKELMKWCLVKAQPKSSPKK